MAKKVKIGNTIVSTSEKEIVLAGKNIKTYRIRVGDWRCATGSDKRAIALTLDYLQTLEDFSLDAG